MRNLYALSGKIGFIDLDSAVCSSTSLNVSGREKELARLLSGFLRFENFRGRDIEESAAALTDVYYELCQVQCSKDNIVRRAAYLLGRLHI